MLETETRRFEHFVFEILQMKFRSRTQLDLLSSRGSWRLRGATEARSEVRAKLVLLTGRGGCGTNRYYFIVVSTRVCCDYLKCDADEMAVEISCDCALMRRISASEDLGTESE